MDVIIETTNSGVVELAASDTEKFVPHPRNGGLGAESSVGEWSEWLMFLWVDGLSLQLHSKKGTSIYAIHIKCCWNQHTNPTTSPSPSFVSILSLLSEDIIFGRCQGALPDQHCTGRESSSLGTSLAACVTGL